jgi:hypothetical protein
MLDQLIQRYQRLQPYSIYAINAEGAVSPWFEVTGAVAGELVLNEQNLAQQVQYISVQISYWARLAAQCKRVWEIEDRNYRIWRSKTWLEILREPEGDEDKPGWRKTAKGDPKAPTKEQAEALYRMNPEYAAWQNRIERAEEAYNATQGILDACKAKRDMLKIAIRRNRETGAPELSI